MSELLDIWYDAKKQEKDRNYIKVNNYWLKKGSIVYAVDLDNLHKSPIDINCDDICSPSVVYKYFPTYKLANNFRINLQIEELNQQINNLKEEL